LKKEPAMTRQTYHVVRRPGGWAVEYDSKVLCCYRSLEQAVAQARELGREDWRAAGRPSEIQVQSVTGRFRVEAIYGHDRPVA
jgi:hypothetical protein